MRCAKFGVAVCKASMLNWRRASKCHRYMCIVLYIERDAITCAKFGVVVFKESVIHWKQSNVPWVNVHCTIYETYLVLWFCRDLCSIGGGGAICHRYMCIVLYTYRSAMRCAKCDVVVLQASMLNRGGQFAMDICTLYYI